VLFLILFWLLIGPDTLAVKAKQAKQAMAAGDFNRAIELYSELDRAVPGNVAIQQNLGLALYSAGQYADAGTVFEKVLQTDPNNRPALLFTGIGANRLNEPRRAIPFLAKFLAEAGENATARLEIGISYLAVAKQDFDWIDDHAPFSSEWFALMARFELEKNHYAKAFQLFHKAQSGSSATPGIHAGLADIYRRTGHPDWASIEDQRERKVVGSADSEASRRYLEAIGNQQNAAGALEHLTRLPEGPEVHELLGFAYRAQHRDTESAQEFHRALQLQPANFRLKKEWAVSLWLSGDCSAAERAIKPLLGTKPTSPQLSHVMGDCLVKDNEPEAALPLLTTVLKRDPAFFPAEASLGRAYMHLGRYRDAIPHLKKALVLNDRLTLYQLAQAYKKIGENTEADRYLREFNRYQNSTNSFSHLSDNAEIAAPRPERAER
jgi:tetratricopeptide (TPR) repeat protein